MVFERSRRRRPQSMTPRAKFSGGSSIITRWAVIIITGLVLFFGALGLFSAGLICAALCLMAPAEGERLEASGERAPNSGLLPRHVGAKVLNLVVGHPQLAGSRFVAGARFSIGPAYANGRMQPASWPEAVGSEAFRLPPNASRPKPVSFRFNGFGGTHAPENALRPAIAACKGCARAPRGTPKPLFWHRANSRKQHPATEAVA